MCAESSSSEGRMRLPPPSRRYSAISVMVLTLEAASRPNSCSIATRSSRSRSKTSLAVAIASVLKLSGSRVPDPVRSLLASRSVRWLSPGSHIQFVR